MTRYFGNHPSTRQTRGRRQVRPATKEERLASMRRELERRERVYGPTHPLTEMQRQAIEGLIRKEA